MLKTLKIKTLINYFMGSFEGFGFLMNRFSKKEYVRNINKSKLITISPLEMRVLTKNKNKICLAINDVNLKTK